MNERKIYVIDNDRQYANWMQGVIVNKMEEADLVVFTGGEDVDPSVYQELKGDRTYSNLSRDEREIRIYKMAKAFGIPMIGICRGLN